ncbi:hypothetical protein QWJ34_19490 [Saccharibacillus sp. CPCC 101409]|uniref:hypothetical protein n=1 Tax=Saccharibacillus sp. CPCC 101409 TaxID=3058041 RepID=UPI002672BE9A|nr:hypothetical protein [Saccharibacillus sp. CPCC 101409]MDO3411955.1 hypothetical protein [Saccharibacillus sp. CPCC 101409]
MIVWVIGFGVLFILLYFGLSHWLLGGRSVAISDPPGVRVQKIGLLLLTVLALGVLYMLYFVADITSGWFVFWFFIAYWAAQMGLQAWLEWRFLKGSRQYAVSLLLLAFLLVCSVVARFTFPPLG